MMEHINVSTNIFRSHTMLRQDLLRSEIFFLMLASQDMVRYMVPSTTHEYGQKEHRTGSEKSY